MLRRASLTATTLVTAALVAGCGGGSGPAPARASGSATARRLLTQTFDGRHAITSGVITLELRVLPQGSSSLRQPLVLTFGGPFMDRGKGVLPDSDFTVAISIAGHRGALQVISAGDHGYITVGGQSYRMPAATFRSLESGVGGLATSGGASGSGGGAFSSLGIRPLRWLTDPQLAGTATIDGIRTTAIRAGLNTAVLLADLSRLVARSSAAGLGSASSLTHGISPGAQQRIVHALGTPRVEVWTGVRDRLMRRLTVSVVVPVSGQARAGLAGTRSAAVTLALEYSRVNQPQTITAPAVTRPYRLFRAEATKVLQEIESGLLGGTGTGTGTGTTTTGGAGVGPVEQRYVRCIAAAHGDVAKMQRCAGLLTSG